MKNPSPSDIQRAVSVLTLLRQRIDEAAANRVTKLPDSRLGDQHAAQIESQTLEQTARIEAVIAQLETWREELNQLLRQHVSRRV